MNRRAFFARVAAVGVAAVLPWRKRRPTVCGINQATFSFWRNRGLPQDQSAYDNLRSAMRDIYNQCSVPSDDAVYWLSPDGPYRLGDGAAELLRDVEIPS